jgi:hypothetical protein
VCLSAGSQSVFTALSSLMDCTSSRYSLTPHLREINLASDVHDLNGRCAPGVIPHAELTVLAALVERSLFVGCKYRHAARAKGKLPFWDKELHYWWCGVPEIKMVC